MDQKEQFQYHVGEMAQYFGVSRDTLRLYDRLGILQTEKNPHNSYRVYNREDVIGLDFVMRLKRLNLSLEEIKLMVNGATIERMEAMMQVQEKILEQKLAEVQACQVMVRDYQKSFSNMIQNRGHIRIVQSPVMICKMVEDSMLVEAMKAFDQLSLSHVPKGTFMIPKENFHNPECWENFERSETRQKFFTYGLTLLDDENFAAKPDFPSDVFQVLPSHKCVYSVAKAETGKDYSEFFRCRDFISSQKLVLAGDPMFRLCAMQYNGVAYYEFWAPIE